MRPAAETVSATIDSLRTIDRWFEQAISVNLRVCCRAPRCSLGRCVAEAKSRQAWMKASVSRFSETRSMSVDLGFRCDSRSGRSGPRRCRSAGVIRLPDSERVAGATGGLRAHAVPTSEHERDGPKGTENRSQLAGKRMNTRLRIQLDWALAGLFGFRSCRHRHY